jgi:hypothetical protein
VGSTPAEGTIRALHIVARDSEARSDKDFSSSVRFGPLGEPVDLDTRPINDSLPSVEDVATWVCQCGSTSRHV